MTWLKQRWGNSPRLAGLVAALLAAALGAHAQSPPQTPLPPAGEGPLLVLTHPGEPVPSGLLLALRVQLGATLRIETRTVPDGLDVAAINQAATSMLATEHGRAVVWTGPSEGGREVYVCRLSLDGAAQLTAALVPGVPGPDLDRTLALKISEMLEGATPKPVSAQDTTPPAPAPAPAPPSRPTAEAARPSWRLGFLGQVAGVVSPRADSSFGQFGPALAAGASVSRPALRGAALLEIAWLPAIGTRTVGDVDVAVQELTPALRVNAQLSLGKVWLGAEAGFAVSLLHPSATTARGDYADRTVAAPSWLAGLGIELPLIAELALALDGGVQVQLRRQRFSVFGVEVADSGRLRPLGRIAISFRPSGRE
jgi:hypothetical protein